MAVEFTSYAVAGWGVGELWTGKELVLAHEFAFKSVSDTGGATTSTLSRSYGQEGDGSRARIVIREGEQTGGTIDAALARSRLDTISCLTPKVLVERLTAFLGGADISFTDVPLDLDWTTRFQHAVADALRGIPRGDVVSYGELAALAGYPGAARAVGTFCAENRFMFFLPCHRVVGASGIGGYGAAGVDVKRRLLALEGIRL